MTFTHEDQIAYAKVALGLFDSEKTDSKNLETILEFGELIKKYSDQDNALIFDVTEYLYEQLRLLQGQEGAFDNVNLRNQIEQDIQSHSQS